MSDISGATSRAGDGAEPSAAQAGAGTPAASCEFRRARASAENPDGSERSSSPLLAWTGRTLLRASSHVPLRLLHAVARGGARAASRLPTREARLTRINVALCFPELSAAERERFVRASLVQTACMAVELGHLWLRPVPEVLARIVEVRGEEHLIRAMERGRGAIFAGPHLGAWELAGLWIGSRYPITTLYRAPRVREMEEFYSQARRRSGAKLCPADASGVRAVFQALGRGEVAAILPDQDPGRGAGVFVPFFGVAANTTTLLSRIAARSKASVLLMFAERLSHGRYRIHIHQGSDEISGDDLERGARALNADIETCVRMCPEQYLWSYKRFKFQPTGSPDLYS
ncbi:MAG TPA: lysophospholipid acyltransferase family protein [Planctomycetota bacterium]|nr:lysophospholipid acyltransferase family protein [Planctomycetota bacterium]